MEMHIPDSLSESLREIGGIGGEHVYLVGGSVRDMLLKRPIIDIDIVVEGDAIIVAKQLQKRWNGKLQIHPQFGTATVTPENPDKPKIDFVTARSETYQKPATLPKVEPGTITDDLLRRDFTINALAMSLDANTYGNVIDISGGLDDLKSGTVRVLHNRSYTDDPTRIFRACRYAGRFNFQITDSDGLLIQEAISLISQLSGERIRNEIERVFVEANVSEIVQLLNHFGVFKAISKSWNVPSTFSCDFQTAQKAIAWASEHIDDKEIRANLILWMSFFGLENGNGLPLHVIEVLCYKLVLKHQLRRTSNTQKEFSDEEEIRCGFEMNGISLSKDASFEYNNGKWCIVDYDNENTYVYADGRIYRVQTPITAYRKLHTLFESITEDTEPSAIYQLLNPVSLEVLVLAFCNVKIAEMQRIKIGDYLLKMRPIKPIINGDDLIEWGEKPSKNFERLLKEIFHDQLDGKFKTKSDGYTRYQQLKNQERG